MKEVFVLFKNEKYHGTFSSEKKAINYVKAEIENVCKAKYHYKSHSIEENADTYKITSLDHSELIATVEYSDYSGYGEYYELLLSVVDEYCEDYDI